jgi:hypothetical protein
MTMRRNSTGSILLGVAVWLGTAVVTAIGWSRFQRRMRQIAPRSHDGERPAA